MKNVDISLIIPCYNEEKNIPLIIDKLESHLNDSQFELVLVDNGSSDNSRNLIKSLSKKYKSVTLSVVEKNQGYGWGIFTGLKQARGDFLAWTHADMQTDPEDVFKAYQLIKKEKTPEKIYVKGKRCRRPIFDAFFTFGMSIFETFMLNTFLYDINAQPNFFHKSFLKLVDNPPKDFSFDLYFYYTAMNNSYLLRRFPVYFGKRVFGQSHWNTGISGRIKLIKRTIDFTINLRKRIVFNNKD